MPIIFIAFCTSFIITFISIPLVIRYFRKKNLFEVSGGRKIHKGKIPSMGGIAIFFGFIFAIIIWEPQEVSYYRYLYGGLFLTFFTGIRDDLLPLSPKYKLFSQLLAAYMVVYFSDIRLHSFYGFLGICEVPEILTYILSIGTIVIVTNSFNLIDGLDGLAGLIATIALTFFGIWFFFIEEHLFAIFIFCMVGAVVAFLNFNWAPAKIFMGDTGALIIGFSLSVITIHFIETNSHLLDNNIFKFQGAVSSAIAVIIIPILDTLRVFTSRIMRGKSPFSADKTHIHHILMRIGLNHQDVTITLGLVNGLFILIALLLKDQNDIYLFISITVLGILFNVLLDYFISKKFFKKKKKDSLNY